MTHTMDGQSFATLLRNKIISNFLVSIVIDPTQGKQALYVHQTLTIKPIIMKRKFITGILLLFTISAAMAQEVANGFAAVAGDGLTTTTGGGNATPVTVTTFAALSSAVAGTTARVIIISGTISTTDGGGFALKIGSNKT